MSRLILTRHILFASKTKNKNDLKSISGKLCNKRRGENEKSRIKMSTVSSSMSSPAKKLEAAVKAIERYNAIEASLMKKTAEKEETRGAMDDARARVEEGEADDAAALLVEAEKLHADAASNEMEMFEEFFEASEALIVAFAAAGMRGSEVFAHYYGSVVPSTAETKEMVARTVLEEDAAEKAAVEAAAEAAAAEAAAETAAAEGAAEDAEYDERPAKRSRSQRFDSDSD